MKSIGVEGYKANLISKDEVGNRKFEVFKPIDPSLNLWRIWVHGMGGFFITYEDAQKLKGAS